MGLNLSRSDWIELLKIAGGVTAVYFVFLAILLMIVVIVPKLSGTVGDILSMIRHMTAFILQCCAGAMAVRRIRPGTTNTGDALLLGVICGGIAGFGLWIVSIIVSILMVFVLASMAPALAPLVAGVGLFMVMCCGALEIFIYLFEGAVGGIIGATAMFLSEKNRRA